MDSGDDDEPARSPRQVMTGEDSLSKAVSANITRILEDLLKDYDKTERPSYNEGSGRLLILSHRPEMQRNN